MKALHRAVEIPKAETRVAFAVVTGAVVQAETGDALEGAGVDLKVLDDARDSSRVWRMTNSKGGFRFDSLVPHAYEVRVRRVGQTVSYATIHLHAGQVDTVMLRMNAYRCVGY